jgi:hypothetical protein
MRGTMTGQGGTTRRGIAGLEPLPARNRTITGCAWPYKQRLRKVLTFGDDGRPGLERAVPELPVRGVP